jgi:hypothetical protein
MKYTIPVGLITILAFGFGAVAFAQSSSTVATTTAPEVQPVASNLPAITLEQIPGTDLQVGDFVVGPGRIEVEIKPGQTVIREITVTNRIGDGRSFELNVEDMSGSAVGEQAAVLLGDQDGPYSLRDYFALPSNRISLSLGERARVPVSITMPPNAEPGGYYGAVVVSTVSDNGETAGSVAKSPIVARVGTLFFITVPGDVDKSSEFVDFDTIDGSWWFSKGPVTLLLTHENTGSMHLNPYGEIRVSNMTGSEVGYVELDPWFVLPKSLRTREVVWNSDFLLGRYTITAHVNRGYDDVVDTKTIHIWVLPWQLLAAVFGGLFFIFFIFRLFFSKFELKRK